VCGAGESRKRTRSLEKNSTTILAKKFYDDSRAKILAEAVMDARAMREFFGANWKIVERLIDSEPKSD
jgi:hypothetical protein